VTGRRHRIRLRRVAPGSPDLTGDNTRTNYAEANRALWRQTVIPLASHTRKSFSRWLAPGFGAPLRIDHNVGRIEALAQERARIDSAGFLTR
jgi:phage portal protein BeeE